MKTGTYFSSRYRIFSLIQGVKGMLAVHVALSPVLNIAFIHPYRNSLRRILFAAFGVNRVPLVRISTVSVTHNLAPTIVND